MINEFGFQGRLSFFESRRRNADAARCSSLVDWNRLTALGGWGALLAEIWGSSTWGKTTLGYISGNWGDF